MKSAISLFLLLTSTLFAREIHNTTTKKMLCEIRSPAEYAKRAKKECNQQSNPSFETMFNKQ